MDRVANEEAAIGAWARDHGDGFTTLDVIKGCPVAAAMGIDQKLRVTMVNAYLRRLGYLPKQAYQHGRSTYRWSRYTRPTETA